MAEEKEIPKPWEDKNAPRFEIRLDRVGEKMFNSLHTCLSVENTWYGVEIKRDSGVDVWERADYQHPILPSKSQTLAEGIKRMRMGIQNIPTWQVFAENYILRKKYEANNGVSPSMVQLEFIAGGDKPDGIVIAYQRYTPHQRLVNEAFPARVKCSA